MLRAELSGRPLGRRAISGLEVPDRQHDEGSEFGLSVIARVIQAPTFQDSALNTRPPVSAMGKWWSPMFGGWEVFAQVLTFLFGLVVTTLGFAMTYKLMPRVKVQWRDVWIGATVTALMFSLGRFLIGLYIGKSDVASGFGAAGSLAIVFVWVYYSPQVFLLRAEFTWVYAITYGSMKDVSVKEGVAASSRQTSEADAAADRRAYAEAELEAKLARTGLWSTPEQVAPWDWRAKRSENR